MEALKHDRRYTYSDYAAWDDDTRYELVDGVAYAMSAPSIAHQRVSMQLSTLLNIFLRGKPCEVLASPVDVLLNAAGDRDDTVLQPDIIVVCDESKLSKKYCSGAPDMVIEIVSPSSVSRDRVLKFNKYLQAGVREFWLVDPDSATVSVHVLENGKYTASAYDKDGIIDVYVLEGCKINLADVF